MSNVESVTVYRRGARVTRVVEIEEGAREVRVEGLPLVLDDGSVRVRAEGGARAIDVSIGVDVPPEDPALAPPKDEALEAARAAVELGVVEIARLEGAIARLDALGIEPRAKPKEGEAPKPSPVQARAALAKLRAEEGERLARELIEKKRAHRAAERTLAELEDRAARASSAKNAREHELRKVATVRLEDPKKGRLLLEYVVPGACWAPAYTVWVEGDVARVAMRAIVAQRTGEDWKGARLVLSTADPDRFTELPELAKLRIGRAQPAKSKRGYRAPPEGAELLYADYDRAFGTPEPAPEPEPESDEDVQTPPQPQAAYGAPMPPPAPMLAAPAAPPMMAMRTAAAKGGGGVLGAIGGAIMAPAGLVMDALEESRAPARARMEKKAEIAEAPAAPVFDLDLEAMSYGRLRMTGPASPFRGALTAISSIDLYAEGLRVSIDVGVAIRVAQDAAEIPALPDGYAEPDAPDAYDHAFACDVPVDVPSDGAFHSVLVREERAPAAMRYVTVPREASDVFRVLELSLPMALLAGAADVYEKRADDHTYLLTTELPATPPSATLELGLGVEQAIKVARNTTFTEQRAGLLGGGLSLVHDVVIDLTNNTARDATVEVRERVPIKREDDDEIEIDIGAVEPEWREWEHDDAPDGGHVWNVTLEPGAAQKLKARYVVRISAKNQLVGGNRREA